MKDNNLVEASLKTAKKNLEFACTEGCTVNFTYLSWTTSEIRVRLVPSDTCKPSSKLLYWPFPGGASFVDLFLFVIYVSCLSCCLVCSSQPYGHLLGKGWPLGFLVCDVFLCFCHFPMWCPGTGVVLDCIDSRFLPSSLLCLAQTELNYKLEREMSFL